MTKLEPRKSRVRTAARPSTSDPQLSDSERDALRLLRQLTRETPRPQPVRLDSANRYFRPNVTP